MKTRKYKAVVLPSSDEKTALHVLAACLKKAPLPQEELLANLGLFLTSKNLARLLFFYEMYKKVVSRHGVIVEFGVRWGQTLSLLSALRGILEPFNRHRKILGFDTFAGFKGVGRKDGRLSCSPDGAFSVPKDYESYLTTVLALQERLNPLAHLKRFELIKGDAVRTVPAYFKKHPETIVSMAVFDFDIYAPTKAALKAVKPHLTRGSLLVFDELCDEIFPGETLALKEVFGLNNVKVQRLSMASRLSYIEVP